MENYQGCGEKACPNLWIEAQQHASGNYVHDAEIGITYGNPKTAPDHSMTQKELQTHFDNALKTWRASTCRTELLSMHDRIQPLTGWHFDKIICLATGCFHQRGRELSRNSLLQFACVMDITEELKKRGHGAEGRTQLLVQDPGYTEKDKELISSQGDTVLAIDECSAMGLRPAMDYMDAHTLVFEYRLKISKEKAIDFYGTEVGLHIGTEVQFLREPLHQFDLTGLAD